MAVAGKPVPSAKAQPLPRRHVPQRTCVGCRSIEAKRGLIRVVRTLSGTVALDSTGRLAGRGAYLHREADCLKECFKKGRLARALHVTITPEDQKNLENTLQQLLAGLSAQA